MSIYCSLLPHVEILAREAGEAIMAIYERSFVIEQKKDHSPLTEADLEANQIITSGLGHLTPNIPVLSEEAVDDFLGPNALGQYWLVDPLDGTKEFVKKNGEFTVNIALINQGKSVLGAVYAPAMKILYAATEGNGSFKVDARRNRTRIQVEQHRSNTPWKIVGSRSHGGGVVDWINRLEGEVELISMGSSLKFCMVAEGAAHLYPRLGPTSLWDTAAAQCIVEESGGMVLGIDGIPISYNRPSITTNPSLIASYRYFKMNWIR